MDVGDYIAVVVYFISLIAEVVAVVSCIIIKQQLIYKENSMTMGVPILT